MFMILEKKCFLSTGPMLPPAHQTSELLWELREALREGGHDCVREKIMTISKRQMTRKITNSCSHTLFMFVFYFGAQKLVSLMSDVRVEKV